MADHQPLGKMAQSFKQLVKVVYSQMADVEVALFSYACSLMSSIFSCLGFTLSLAKEDYVEKVSFDCESCNLHAC